MIEETVTTALGLASKVPDILRSAKSDSLIEFTKPTRVEPIVLMDDKVVNLPFTHDIMQSLSSIFSGYYLQAVSLSVNVGSVDVIRLLDKVNPNRSLDDNLVRGVTNAAMRAGFEDASAYEYGLPVPGQPVGLEAFGNEADIAHGSDNAIKLAQEASNLSVGKLLEVKVESDGAKAVFPVAVRLIVTTAPSSAVVHTLSVGNKDTSVKERFHAWRSGQLEFIRDLVLCQDLIEAHKKALLKDNSGIYMDSIKRRKRNFLSAILSGSPSVATASNLVVISESTRKELERNVGGRLKDFRTREKIFKETYAMLLVVVDPDWEQVTIYHRSIEQPTQLSAGDLKSSNRSKGPDVGEILKAYQLGNSPTL